MNHDSDKKQNLHDIPSAGPWISQLEIDYVTDAVENGWYKNWSGYIDKFEKAFAEFVGVKHAISTSSCTGAIHIAAKALGLGAGDEVIAPEVTWIGSVAGPAQLGCSIVFADVEPDTWCLDPESFRKAITPRTKAVIPVDMYGHPAAKDEILNIAREHEIHVLEDSAPGLGSKYNGQACGSFGIVGTFSFQGAKPLVTGEGGMLVTDDDNVYERCYYYWDHCRDPGQVLYNTDIGFKYKMSNIQAALGLAQLERADEIIGKRRQIYRWYQQRLGDIPGIQLNTERAGCFSNHYVPTIILNGSFPVTPQELMDRLDQAGIRNRPFFRPLSKLPMFSPADTPVADHLAAHGINLPCASRMTEEQVDYVCAFLRRQLLPNTLAA